MGRAGLLGTVQGARVMYRWAELVHWVWSEDPGSTTGRQSWSVMYGLRIQGHVQVRGAGWVGIV